VLRKKQKILNVLYISYYVLDEYSLVLVLKRMSKKLKSVTKKLFGGKGRAGMVDILFQGHSSATKQTSKDPETHRPDLGGPNSLLSERWGNLNIFIPFCNMNLLIVFSYNFAERWELGAGGWGGGCRTGKLRGCEAGGELEWSTRGFQGGGGCGAGRRSSGGDVY
jgi:hypothetical protein